MKQILKSIRQLSAKQLIICAALAFFLIIGNNVEAQSVANKLRTVPEGADSTTLVNLVGNPTKKNNVIRWYYGKDEAVFMSGKIIDIRLHERLHKVKLKKEKGKTDDTTNPIAYLRIGMTPEEAIENADEPDFRLEGEDWYFTKRHRVELNQGKVDKISFNIKASLETLDWIRLNFSSGSLLIMNITIAFIMFGVALGIKISGFRELIKNPKLVLIGWSSQFILLPALTFLLILIIRPTPSVAMGMILVAACPGGNVSNFISSLAKGNIALSVSLTAIATIMAVLMTPLNFFIWGTLYSKTSELVIPFTIDHWEMLKTVFILLGIPLFLGIWFSNKFPDLTKKIIKPIKWLSILIFLGYIFAALSANLNFFFMYIHLIFLIVLVHNALAFSTGYGFASLLKLSDPNRRTITVETGIQNSGIALVLIFNPHLFNGLGGMAFIAAWWGIWHIIAGMSLGFWWGRKPLRV
ncbi:MAG: bile acid:sodium symporter family protein [Marinilabiliaceae bacterium]|nr:bile acid:sodium symporter family protein [Marinilabiliaceae bacterium]